MGKLVNLWGDSNADIVSDDSTPTLTLKNTSTGAGLRVVNTGTGPGVEAIAPIGGATLASLRLIASTASQAVLEIQGVFMSTASIAVTAATSAFIIPVYHQTEKVWGYLTASKGVV